MRKLYDLSGWVLLLMVAFFVFSISSRWLRIEQLGTTEELTVSSVAQTEDGRTFMTTDEYGPTVSVWISATTNQQRLSVGGKYKFRIVRTTKSGHTSLYASLE